MTHHVGILDNDPIRLLTPLIDERIAGEHLILVGDKTQYDVFLRIQQVLKQYEVSSEFFEIPDVVNTTALKGSMQELANYLDTLSGVIKLNASCGIRHRLLSVYEIFRQREWPIYVIEPNSDRLCWLFPANRTDLQVQDNIHIKDYLNVFGARAEFHQAPNINNPHLFAIGKKWASNALELGTGLATLNFLATTCRKEQVLSVSLSPKQQGYVELASLIQDLVDADLASYANGLLTFTSDETRRFANGEWLEIFVHATVKQLQSSMPTIQDHSQAVQVYRQRLDKEIRNELDVAIVVNNKLHIIECKTKGMRDDGDDTLYKLESLRDLLGGLQARALLVSFRPLRNNDKFRAQDLGLALIGPEELKDLDRHLLAWLRDAGGNEL